MNKCKYYIVFLSLALIAVLIAGCGADNESSGDSSEGESSEEERVFKLGHTGSESHVWQESIQHFDKKLQELSDGQLSIEIYPNSTLGNDEEMLQQMGTGSLDMAWITLAELTNHSSSFNAWFMPFIMNNMDEAYEVSKTDEALALFDTLENNSIQSLGYTYIGMRHVLMDGDPVSDLSDLEGNSMRVSPSPVIVDFWETMGSSPTSIPIAELYTSFERGVIDGVDIDLDALISQRLNEVGEGLTLTNHMTFHGASFVSDSVWAELSEEEQDIIQKAFDSAQQYNYEKSKKYAEDNLQTFKEEGGNVLEEVDSSWREGTEDFRQKYADEDELIKEFIDKSMEVSSGDE
ncbi:TRAP transporter substrate-binding protein [Salibacterium salarium]|uniref:TRAP transporter substrate-binding protein n=1 Tax=Salibacterium salarium TaxID=284579 RepID=A0A428MZ85_9BACI|nr:TRAP transporter substrate-binding protein [Salibacterium salarium]RSL31463.1 TRAP transporter substrate-binding protein [Salibacterium salarium]